MKRKKEEKNNKIQKEIHLDWSERLSQNFWLWIFSLAFTSIIMPVVPVMLCRQNLYPCLVDWRCSHILLLLLLLLCIIFILSFSYGQCVTFGLCVGYSIICISWLISDWMCIAITMQILNIEIHVGANSWNPTPSQYVRISNIQWTQISSLIQWIQMFQK